MAWQTMILFLPRANFTVIAFIFFSTLCSYSFHWYLTPDIDLPSSRLHWLKNHRNTHIVLFLTSILGVAFYGIMLVEYWPWILLSGLITFLYTAPKIPHLWFKALRKVALGKTVFLAFVWTYVTTTLPVQLSGQSWEYEHHLFACSRFFLIYAICILFDYRDREYDRSIGIRSLITWLNEKGIAILFYASLILFAFFTLLTAGQGDYFPVFTLVQLIPGMITAALYKYATKNHSDILYYFLLDGLMALSSLLTLIILLLISSLL
jgi:4-hydroxybenzoate polyprenyltransferase